MLRAVGREIGVFVVFLLLATAVTWPLAIRLSTAVSDLGDPLHLSWIINWDQYAWTHAHPVFQAPVFYPAKNTLAFSENLFGVALVTLPFYLAGCSPLVVHNIAMLLGFAFCGYGASVLARVVSRSMTAGLICGSLFAFVPYREDHIAHLHLTWSGWLPLVLAALIVYWRNPGLRTAALFGAALLMNGLTNIHWLLFGTMAAGIAAVVLFCIAGQRPWRFWITLALATAVALALLVPILLPYKEVSKLYGMRRDSEAVMFYSADWRDWLLAAPRNRTWGALPDWSAAKPERQLFPGMLSLFLTGAAIVLVRRRDIEGAISVDIEPMRVPRWVVRGLDVLIVLSLLLAYVGAVAPRYELRLGSVRLLSLSNSATQMVIALTLILLRFAIALPRAWMGGRSLREAVAASRFPPELWIAVLWIVLGVLGSLGLKAFFHAALYRHIEAFQGLRVPARWAMVAYTGLVVTGAAGVVALLRERSGRGFLSRVTIIVTLVIAMYYDLRPRIVWEHAVDELEPVYRWMIQSRTQGPILELPMGDPMIEFVYTFKNAFHHITSMNGMSSFRPPMNEHLAELLGQSPIGDEAIDTLEANGCRIVILHEDWLAGAAPAMHAWVNRQLASGRLGFLRRFNHGIEGDWVFAVTKSMPDWTVFRETGRDAAGRTPDEELAAMLADRPTYSNGTIGHLDTPQYSEALHVPFRVAGWALSPYGVRSVDVLLESGRVRVPAELVLRGDVSALRPWYPNVPKPGFQATLAKRPRGVRSDTDLQIEITDGLGRRTRLPDVIVGWK
jgi:hypothetical protein